MTRDDFPASVKDELAKRVGFLCSNPACRQPTSGPQAARSGVVNIGVAAHITAAANGGPRYDARMSTVARTSAENGIWLCQTCAKLIDNDGTRYSISKLAEWKGDAETAAANALEQRRAPGPASEGVFLEAARLMPALISEMRGDVRSEDTELVRELAVLPSRGVVLGGRKERFAYFETEHPRLRLQIDWLEEMGLIVDVTTGNIPIYRMTAAFFSWLRVG